jgi:hypothetical protein
MANEPKKICLGPKALFFLSSHGTHLETYSYYENTPMVPNVTILQLMQLYATIFSTYATILQLYASYATICNYIASICNLCNYMQLYCNYIYCNYMQLYYATMQLFATMQLYCNYGTICNMPYATCLSNEKSFKNSM